jgi:hypothetical protein
VRQRSATDAQDENNHATPQSRNALFLRGAAASLRDNDQINTHSTPFAILSASPAPDQFFNFPVWSIFLYLREQV